MSLRGSKGRQGVEGRGNDGSLGPRREGLGGSDNGLIEEDEQTNWRDRTTFECIDFKACHTVQ